MTVKLNTPQRMDIYYVDLRGGNAGSEQADVRPCVILQNNVGNKFSPSTIVAPFSTASKTKLPTHVYVKPEESGLLRPSVLLCEQIRTVDEYRLMDKVGKITNEDKIFEIEKAIIISHGLENFIKRMVEDNELFDSWFGKRKIR